MKIIRRLLGVVVLLLAVLVGFSAVMPNTYSVERSLTVDAPTDVVYAQVVDLEAYQAWNPWAAKDASMQVTYGATRSGEGAQSSWTSDNSGEGTMTITKAVDNERIETSLDFGEMGSSNGWYTFEPVEGDKTRVTWGFAGTVDKPLIGAVFASMMDGMVGPDFEDGLSRLGAIAAQKAGRAPAEAASTEAASTEAEAGHDH